MLEEIFKQFYYPSESGEQGEEFDISRLPLLWQLVYLKTKSKLLGSIEEMQGGIKELSESEGGMEFLGVDDVVTDLKT